MLENEFVKQAFLGRVTKMLAGNAKKRALDAAGKEIVTKSAKQSLGKVGKEAAIMAGMTTAFAGYHMTLGGPKNKQLNDTRYRI